MPSAPRIVAVVPCYNEEAAIAKVVTDLRATVPGIDVFVYDNCSTDDTAGAAARAGAHVRREEEKGKGNVVRRAFADLDADVYLLIDGDDTYDVADAPAMIETLLSGPYDHVLGVRRQASTTAYRSGHESGNKFFNSLVSFAFRRESKLDHTSFQFPRVAALEYSVARVSKKLACSTPFNSGASQGRGWSSTM